MKTDNSKKKLFEVMSKLDNSFKPKINEWDNYQGTSNKPDDMPAGFDYSKSEFFEDKLEEIIKQMISSDYGYDDIMGIIEKILQKQP